MGAQALHAVGEDALLVVDRDDQLDQGCRRHAPTVSRPAVVTLSHDWGVGQRGCAGLWDPTDGNGPQAWSPLTRSGTPVGRAGAPAGRVTAR
ncbi:hypothetical protein GCM10009737_23890 [Nocardioides lentus]|uniref:Uncharacterized protein n=1 Tax=Nocardioides lentus TaxID=338077 RepID=A0ABP5AXU5_9ACTN